MLKIMLVIVKLLNVSYQCFIISDRFSLYFVFFIAFSNLPLEDRKELTLNSVHAIRYLWLHKQNKNMNYFNLDDNDRTITTINDLFPIFKKADLYFKTIHESKIRNLCLDPKEFSLYSALIIFVVGMLNSIKYAIISNTFIKHFFKF